MLKIVVLAGIVMVALLPSVHAQKDAEAKQILAGVSKKYRLYDIVKADFSIFIEDPQSKIKETQAGVLYVRSKTNQYKMILSDRELISNGKTLWTYLKDDKEVQISDAGSSSDELNPSSLFTIYEKGYKYIYMGESKINKRTIQNIELSPTDSKSHYFKIRLSIDKLLKQITAATIFDKNGSRYSYSIKSFVPNVKVPPGIFTFDPGKYPGTELVDLR